MKTALFLLFTLTFGFCFQSTAGASFHFPDQEFEYAKIYYFNTGELDGKPDYYVYTKEDGWAESLVDIDQQASKALTSNIEKLFLPGADGLLTGLSKCFIPRHGIVYFDKNDMPVASISICFECEAIRMWTKSKGKIEPKTSGSVKGAAQQIKTLKNFILKEEIIVSEDPRDYPTIISLLDEKLDKKLQEKEKEVKSRVEANKEPKYVGATMTFDLTELDPRIARATYEDVWNWNTAGDYSKDMNIEYSAGGEKYEFIELHVGDSTHVYFDGPDQDAKLVGAEIRSEHIILPNGLHVGSTLDEVYDTILKDYNSLLEPGEIILNTESQSIRYRIIDKKVWKINIHC